MTFTTPLGELAVCFTPTLAPREFGKEWPWPPPLLEGGSLLEKWEGVVVATQSYLQREDGKHARVVSVLLPGGK